MRAFTLLVARLNDATATGARGRDVTVPVDVGVFG